MWPWRFCCGRGARLNGSSWSPCSCCSGARRSSMVCSSAISAGGVAILSFAMFCLLAGLALRYDRWWLLLAAGAQLIALSTHFAGVAGSDALLWSIVSTRMVVWFELLLLAVFGVWEARAAPYAEKPYASAAADAARR